MTGTYTINQLKLLETEWVVLNLEAPTPGNGALATVTSNDSTAGVSTNMEDVPPTVRLRVTLVGPYRPEVAALLQLSQTWFAFMDSVEHSAMTLVEKSPKLPLPQNKGLLLIPAVPAVTAAVVIAPIVAGLCVLFLPIFVPVLAAILTIGACLGGTGFLLWASTSSGRSWVNTLVEPASQTLLQTPSGQSLLFETGPRPTPVSVARVVLPSPDNMWGRLMVSLLVDGIGSASYLVPIVGEVTDIIWAPLQTCLIMALYDTTTPNLKYLSFAEEILPFTDFVPSATIGWAAQFGPQLLLKGPASAAAGVPTSLTVPAASAKKD